MNSSVYSPIGLAADLYTPTGLEPYTAGTILTGYAVNIFQNAPIRITTDGTIIVAAAGTRALGSFQGVEYNPTATGPRVVSNMWPASTAAVNIVAYYTRSQQVVYEIQADDTLTVAALGQQYDWTTNDTSAGNTVTGLSTVGLDVSTAAANAGLRVVGLRPGPLNAWGDAFPIVQVQISEHQDVADIASY